MLYDPKWEVPVETKPVEPWRDLLRAAAKIVRKRGLARYRQLDCVTGAVCLHGAINAALTGCATQGTTTPLHCEATLAVYRFLRSKGVDRKLIGPSGCAEWSNVAAKDAEEVACALEGAAAYVE